MDLGRGNTEEIEMFLPYLSIFQSLTVEIRQLAKVLGPHLPTSDFQGHSVYQSVRNKTYVRRDNQPLSLRT